MFLDAAYLILQVTDKLTIWARITIEITQIKFMSTHAVISSIFNLPSSFTNFHFVCYFRWTLRRCFRL